MTSREFRFRHEGELPLEKAENLARQLGMIAAHTLAKTGNGNLADIVQIGILTGSFIGDGQEYKYGFDVLVGNNGGGNTFDFYLKEPNGGSVKAKLVVGPTISPTQADIIIQKYKNNLESNMPKEYRPLLRITM